jgi:hypothetical protein
VSEISANLNKEIVSNSTFTPKGYFSPSTSFFEKSSFGISYDGSWSFQGGWNEPEPHKIHVYANLLDTSNIKIN